MKQKLLTFAFICAIVLCLASCEWLPTFVETTTTTTATTVKPSGDEPVPHVHTPVVDEAIPATCASTGLSEGSHCSECGEILTAQIEIPKNEHIESDWITDAEPTVDREGSKHTQCAVCGATVKTEDIAKLMASEGLELMLNSDGESYSVFGIGTCEDMDIVIPSTYEGKPVTRIESAAFYNCNNIETVTIPESVIVISESAFAACRAMTTVNISASVMKIETGAFEICPLLTSINVDKANENYRSVDGNLYSKDGKTLIKYAIGKEDTSFVIPDGVTTVYSMAFCGAESLITLTVPDSVTYMESSAFQICSHLTGVYYGGTLEQWCAIRFDNYTSNPCSIKAELYIDGTVLRNAVIPDTVSRIGDYAFANYQYLTTLTIGNGAIEIGEGAFYNSSLLKSVVIGDGVTVIKKNAFYHCSSLESVVIGIGTTRIESSAFENCDSLLSVTIGGGTVSIAAIGFANCKTLRYVTIGSGTSDIHMNAFNNCPSLENVNN